MSTLLGTKLNGRYRLDEKIGVGGCSTVYKAADERLERWVAVKVMHREVADDSYQLMRFRREAKAVAQLSHENLVGVIDTGEDAGHPYIVFEYVPGETLKQRIQRGGLLPIPEAVAYAIEIARALEAAHSHHIVHRDVKPQNVLIDADSGSVKITDFGIARTLEEDGITSDGRVVGTTDYVSPEQAMGIDVSGQSDIYSLGIVLYEMLTGELPFAADSQVAVAMKHVREDVPDVRVKRPEVSVTLAGVLDAATAKHTADRYQNDGELIADLEEVLALETSRSGEATGEVASVLNSLAPQTRDRVPRSIRRRGRSIATLAAITLLIAAVIVVLVLRVHTDQAQSPTTTAAITPIKLCQTCAVAYNPDGIGGTAQNNSQAGRAVDGDDSTRWTTQRYFTGQLGKPGVGLYVRLNKPTQLRQLTLITSTPGFDVTIYGSTSTPDPTSFTDSSWKQLASVNSVTPGDSMLLGGGDKRFSYVLVWITQLPPKHEQAAINEIELYT